MKKIFGLIKRILKSRLFRYSFLAVFLGCLAGGSLTFYKLYQIAQTLPPVEEITQYRYVQPSMVYDSEGHVIAELGVERRYPISISAMPVNLRNAVVAVEDSRFYEHSGVDAWGIMRAVVKNLRSGRFSEGGSTLTQQLVKNLYLSPEKKLIRKYKEAVLAYRIDKYLTKDEILEYYLNFVNFGRGGYGVQAASMNYFGKNAPDMTLAECALLAGIPKAPSIYSPHINKERAKVRRDHVLVRMYENGYINEDEYLAAIEEPIVIIESTPQRLRMAGYFLDHVLKYLSEDLGISDPQNKGLRVYTTLNIDFQSKAEAAVQQNLIAISKRIGYFGPVAKAGDLTSDNATIMLEDDSLRVMPTIEDLLQVPGYLESMGYKKAIVTGMDNQQLFIKVNNEIDGKILLKNNRWARKVNGGTSQLNDFKTILAVNDIIYVTLADEKEQIYDLQQDPPMEAALMAIDPQSGAILSMVGGFAFEKSMFNRATQAKRQVGSVFKPLVYAAALETGMQPMDKVLDAPILSGPNEKGVIWRPKNDDDKYFGETTLKEGVTRSRNIVTIKVSEQVGIRNVINFARLFGVTTHLPADLSITLGSGSIPLSEMVYAYSTFPNLGTRPESHYFITRVEDLDGNILYLAGPPEHVEVIHPNTAQIMTDLLVNVVEKGTGFRAREISRPIGAKTGTTNENRDAWFIGFMPNLTVGVWVGFDEYAYAVGYGGQTAAPMWVDYITSIEKDIPLAVFPVAEGVEYRKVDMTLWEETDELIPVENISFEPFHIALSYHDPMVEKDQIMQYDPDYISEQDDTVFLQ